MEHRQLKKNIGSEVNEKVSTYSVSINKKLIIIENTVKKDHAFLTKSHKFLYLKEKKTDEKKYFG